MRWQVKAAIQSGVSILPGTLSYAVYYKLQRLLGGLHTPNPTEHVTAGVRTWQHILQENRDPVGKSFFEVGTGRIPTVPIVFWLMGARRTITVDINPYLKEELVGETLGYIAANRERVSAQFGDLLQTQRMDELLRFYRSSFSLRGCLELCNIEYIEPGDAAQTGLPDGSIDFHTSYTVLEHIPPEVIVRILREGNRILTADGLFVHLVDYTDHFSHSDRSISSVNFLQYSDRAWWFYAGNRFMYTNRLRHDDVLKLYEAGDQRLVSVEQHTDPRARQELVDGKLRLDGRFASKSLETLSTPSAWIVSEPLHRIPALRRG